MLLEMHAARRVSRARAHAPSWRLVVAALLALAALSLAACGGSGTSSTNTSGEADANAGPAQRGGTLKVGTAFEPTTLDPAIGQTDPGSQHAQVLIFDRLVTVEPGSVEIKPSLAESWKLSADKRSMTFKLRDAQFSDGSPVTSADVKFSLARAVDPKVDATFAESLQRIIASVTTPDSRTVVVHFDGPQPAVLSWLAFAPCSIVSQRAFERIGAKRFGVAPVDAGSGPFKLVKWTRGQSVQLVRNPHYWQKGLPYLDGVDLQLVSDDNTRLLDLRSGGLDVADDVPYSQLDAISKVPGIRLQVRPVAAVFGPFLSGRGPLKDVKVRQALNYATPRDAIVKVALHGQGELAGSWIPPMKYPDARPEPIPLDVAKARQLIAASDHPDGFELELLIQSGDAVSRQTASMLQDAWKQIGVDLNIQSVETGSFISRAFAGDFQAFLGPPTIASSDIPSEDEFAVELTTPVWENTILGHADPVLRSLSKQLNGTWDESVRRELYKRYMLRMQEDPVFVPIALASARSATREQVHGFDYVLMNWLYLTRTWIER
jgi:peptide/nickel transport system substrate-binding protein